MSNMQLDSAQQVRRSARPQNRGLSHVRSEVRPQDRSLSQVPSDVRQNGHGLGIIRDNGGQRVCERVPERLAVRLHLKDGKKEFDATVRSTDISLSGVFFASTFLLKLGTVMDLEFRMPHDSRQVRVRGVVAREVRLDEAGVAGAQAGFAIRFLSYGEHAKTILASSFLAAELDGFLASYARDHRVPHSEVSRLRQTIVAWEVGKLDLAAGEMAVLGAGLLPGQHAA
jgi:hypothetical protein